MPDVTHILASIDAGDPHAAAELLPLVYDELRNLAAAQMAAEKPGQTLDATALVHEAYVRLVGARRVSEGADAPLAGAAGAEQFANRAHFFAAAAEAMRRILVETARRKARLKHGGDRQRRELHADLVPAPEPDENLLALDAALVKFAERDPIKARLVELRYFGGLTGEQAAQILGISASTADRHWVFARAWLRRELDAGPAGEEKSQDR